MGTTAGTNAGGIQGVPLTAGPQHKENGVHRPAVGHPRIVTAEWMRFTRRQERFDLGPEFV
jgi:hypothetical protein